MKNKYIYPNDNYRIRVDGRSYRLEKKYFKQDKRGRNGDKNGNFSYRAIGYYKDIGHLADALLELEVKANFTKDLQELKDHLDGIKEDIIRMISDKNTT